MTKRKKIIISSLLLSLGFLLIHSGIIDQRYLGFSILIIASILLSAWSLWEGLKGWTVGIVLLLPNLFTVAVGLFYFLLPGDLVAKLPVTILFGIGYYVLLLTGNIFSVASVRNIQLLRSAQATGFLLTLITAFLLFDAIFSYRFDPWLNALIVLTVSFLLTLQGLWSITLEESISKGLLTTSLSLALILGEFSLAISFWPLSVSSSSLFLITALYVLLGLTQSDLQKRLFQKTIREYLWVGVIVFLTIFLTTGWGG